MPQTELLGYAASFLVVMSLLMGDIKRLRYINLVGCVLFETLAIKQKLSEAIFFERPEAFS